MNICTSINFFTNIFLILFQKRNAVAGDEDLFEFMVRIANTPVEWERIRRVLSKYSFENNEFLTLYERKQKDFDQLLEVDINIVK